MKWSRAALKYGMGVEFLPGRILQYVSKRSSFARLGGYLPSDRRDFAILALISMLLNSSWVLLFLSFYPVWGGAFDEDRLAIRIFPSVMALLTILETMVGSRSIENNQSSYVLTAMYLNSKFVSVVVLLSGADRVVMGDGVPGLALVLGVPLICLQVIKMCSASVAIHRYHAGTPDEKLPNFTLLRFFDFLGWGCMFLGSAL